MQENDRNQTLYEEFYALPLSNQDKITILILISISVTYVISIAGNMIITLLVFLVDHLHTPMYFFLCSLSIQDIIHVSNIQPKLLVITVTGDTRISFSGCIMQIFLFVLCIDTEFFLLTSMAYDRYVAICKPLHYNRIMNKRTCSFLICLCWIAAALNALMYSILISKLSFCKSHDINNFFCDLKIILSLSCSDTTYLIRALFFEIFLFGIVPFLCIITSYVFIITTILKIQSSSGRLTRFSSCSSHITTVILLCGTTIGSYLKPGSEQSNVQNAWGSLLYTVLVPLLNPLVYSLRNKEVIKAIKSFIN